MINSRDPMTPLARIYECLPLRCLRCSQPMRLIAFIIEPPVIERILTQIGQPTTPPPVLPARSRTAGAGHPDWD